MKRAEVKLLANKYGMEILRNPVTEEAWGLYLESAERIDELDALTNQEIYPCVMLADYSCQDIGRVTYKLVCPANWFDLWGWADE